MCVSVSGPLYLPLTTQYAEDQAAFFKDYAVSHAKLSELGSEWEVEGGVKI